MYNSERGILGEKFVREILERSGYKVSKRMLGKTGYDLEVEKNGKILTVEIKTTGNLKGGIPDMHNTEFSEFEGKYYFVADRLFIVRLDENFNPLRVDILTKEDIDKYADSHKTVTRIRTTKLDTDIKNGKIGKTINVKVMPPVLEL